MNTSNNCGQCNRIFWGDNGIKLLHHVVEMGFSGEDSLGLKTHLKSKEGRKKGKEDEKGKK